MLEAALIIAGLTVFEVINSIDNAIINSEVLSTMSARAEMVPALGDSHSRLRCQRTAPDLDSMEQ